MKNSRIVRTAAVAAVLFATIGANAQSEASSKSIPLHVEASLGACTPSNKVLPLDVNVDLNYTFAKRFSLHATTTTSYFMPKNGATHDYNSATNLGGGLGYVFLREGRQAWRFRVACVCYDIRWKLRLQEHLL